MLTATPKILQGPRSQGAKILTNLTLPCKASGVPPPKITWSRADRRELNFWSGKFTIMENGALIITSKIIYHNLYLFNDITPPHKTKIC